MDEIKSKSARAASQAWRSKPRKFAPKSRLGCKTCKIRRIKCDLSQPSCMKCQSTGRTCDGYSEMPYAFKADIASSHYHGEKPNRADNCDNYNPNATICAYQAKQWHAKSHDLSSHNLGPLMVLPATGPAQTEAMCFFEYISIKHLNEYRSNKTWRKTLMFFSQTVPSVRYAATALALANRSYLDRDSRGRLHQPSLNKDALFYYNRAIQLLLNQDSGDSDETTAITLLVCYLFTCFDHLAGNYVQAMKHLRGGVELSRNIDKTILDNNAYDDAKSPAVRTLICQVTRQIRRLDTQAATFLVDWTPIDVQETLIPHHLPSNNDFSSLDQAADHLQILVARVMGLRNAEQEMFFTGEIPPSPLSSIKENILTELETWSNLFENTLQRGNPYETDSEAYPLISLLRLQYIIAWALLSSYGAGREMEYDNFLPQFQQCIGVLPVLYIIGVKCRHPVVRREVLSILRRQPIREAIWDSISTARVVERVIEIEEGGPEKREMIRNMEQIAVWQRLEALSWIQESAVRVDITYTFCTREGMHNETLMV
ncbi:fungal zn(2)-Cys(6) binuclear cluster domain-containing protein [Trichoderma breve]|uniref:Fungal zn(2)-Cys(6) binuclear cluster domain-containing protein n=1 Tax=Trichoderma breve TaxID=2034170 RepID=A0A9W9EF92_9HYPO|nr:fungal zn(2)-Cys(6) binuclear cluster domain-containing protein [Trichoderma breve]KAJ4865638.1 fungal zn(2)-Cys(6) binuclear cluster domain-containing protein [Trichoderma breve]